MVLPYDSNVILSNCDRMTARTKKYMQFESGKQSLFADGSLWPTHARKITGRMVGAARNTYWFFLVPALFFLQSPHTTTYTKGVCVCSVMWCEKVYRSCAQGFVTLDLTMVHEGRKESLHCFWSQSCAQNRGRRMVRPCSLSFSGLCAS